MTRWPGILATVAEVAGEAAAQALALKLGGCELKISGRKGGKLARVVGDAAARKIAEALGAEKVTIPMAHLRGQRGRREAAAQLLRAGRTVTEVAQACDVHERTVWRVKNPSEKTLPLFEDDA